MKAEKRTREAGSGQLACKRKINVQSNGGWGEQTELRITEVVCLRGAPLKQLASCAPFVVYD